MIDLNLVKMVDLILVDDQGFWVAADSDSRHWVRLSVLTNQGVRTREH